MLAPPTPIKGERQGTLLCHDAVSRSALAGLTQPGSVPVKQGVGFILLVSIPVCSSQGDQEETLNSGMFHWAPESANQDGRELLGLPKSLLLCTYLSDP